MNNKNIKCFLPLLQVFFFSYSVKIKIGENLSFRASPFNIEEQYIKLLSYLNFTNSVA